MDDFLIPILTLLVIILFAVIVVLSFKLRRSVSPRSNSKLETSGNTSGHGGPPDAVASDALFATLSHELRTPLNGLLGIVQVLKEEKEDENLISIEGCARHMLAVITTLVNHTKIQKEWDNLPEYREWVCLYELLEQIKRHLAFRANQRGLDIQMKHQDKSLRLRGDYDHIKNIIENAILASLECVSLVHVPTERKILTLDWESDDIGVRLRMHNPIEEYSDSRNQKSRSVADWTDGESHSRIKMEFLYWAVSSLLLDRYKGALSSQPDDSGGVVTLISFEMEQMKSTPSANLPIGGLSLDKPESAVKVVKKLPMQLSILVAEDDPVARSLMKLVLRKMEQEVTFATNGQEVLDLLSQPNCSFDMILMDINMPVMDGVSASKALRNGEAGEWGKKIPIAAVTAFGTLSDQSKFKRAGMNYFLSKPVKLDNLREVMLEVGRKDKPSATG